MKWRWVPFAELSAKELYDLLQLREEAFHIEQTSAYCDMDGLDVQARHLLGFHQDQLICYLRVALQNEELIISRVVVRKAFRHQGLGKVMLKNTLKTLHDNYPGYPVALAAQVSQEAFYVGLGFEKSSMPFDGAGVLHVKMQHSASAVA